MQDLDAGASGQLGLLQASASVLDYPSIYRMAGIFGVNYIWWIGREFKLANFNLTV